MKPAHMHTIARSLLANTTGRVAFIVGAIPSVNQLVQRLPQAFHDVSSSNSVLVVNIGSETTVQMCTQEVPAVAKPIEYIGGPRVLDLLTQMAKKK